MRSNLYNDMFRDEYAYINEAVEKSLNSTEEEDRIIAENEAKGFGFNMNAYKTIGKAQGKGVLSVTTNTQLKKRPALDIKKTSTLIKPITTTTTIKKQPLQAKSYENGTISSIANRVPSRPTSSASSKAASLLSLQPVSSNTFKQRPTLGHKRSASTLTTKVPAKSTSAPASRSRSTTSTSRRVINPKLAEVNSKTTVGYAAGRPLAKRVKRDINIADEQNMVTTTDKISDVIDEHDEDLDIVKQLQSIYVGNDLEDDEDDCFQIPILDLDI